MDIKLNYIDRSDDASNSDIVIFQKDASPDFESLAVAWKVIRYCGRGNSHPFVYPQTSQVTARDSWGNFLPKISAEPGQLFHVRLNPSGNELIYKGPATSKDEIQIQNDLAQGVIAASIFKDDRLFALKTGITPSQKAVFRLKPVLYLAVASDIEEGQTLNSAVISATSTEISLEGLISADIVMTGGGQGTGAPTFSFTLQNVQRT
ncbi:MAG: hypothetical protein QNK37_04855 [Acidobacteriota bacterium]|nr:hypothetical protein [Acidobacteriota bacterium]